MANNSSLLLVFTDVGNEITEEEFHDWYGGEHLPLRTQNLSTFRSAARFRAIDGVAPKWVAMYTVSDMETYKDPAYTGLREKRSAREAALMPKLGVVDRRLYTAVSDTTPLPEALAPTSVASEIVVYNSFTPTDADAFNTWYEKQYIPAVKEVPGWTRTRRYKLHDVARVGYEKDKFPQAPEYLEVSEFETLSALHDPKFPSDTAGKEVITSATATERRVFKLHQSYEPTAALKALRTPAAGTPTTEA